ncbi:copper homeostasis protein CutC [Pricia sp.]|uniref:copper homeostasis protein CutC n=1 Tax=Pricia sp. TaxID=2268138 RepID=UPI0035937126
MLIEVCANSLKSALNAEKAGAHRIEICSELAVGGITPSYGLLKSVREKITIPIHVLIRPRSGDFSYSDGEFEIMKTDIKMCVDMGFEGIVSGVLQKDFTLDVERTKILVGASGDLRFTFHRAFDWVKSPLKAFAQLESLGVDCVLTSGQQKSAEDGITLLSELHHKASTITIMPGGGIKPENINVFKEKGFRAAHLSGSKFVKTLAIKPKIPMNSPSYLKDDGVTVSNLETIQKIVNAVK